MVLFTCVFENVQPEHGWTLRTTSAQVSKIINGFIEQSITEAAPRSALVCFLTLSVIQLTPYSILECTHESLYFARGHS